jgi:hypothetical protein
MNAVQGGDIIAAFEGSRVLWTLRPVGDKYRLIGDIWVDGLMQGQSYIGLNPEKVDYEIEII